ncbi:hypothetical protein [Neobacillus bataviensis]|uniref:hypothetical protein n=1 Tax=Neobacillus bataviensis TaxID=220685 RepID=UPI001CBB94FE|nr:hypothetical protein [Neobacillus bataviensis]
MLSTLTPMFDKTKLITIDDHNKKAERKQRSDKKIQIKVPVTSDEKLHIARMSLNSGHRGEIHSYLEAIFKQAAERSYINYSKAVSYRDDGIYVSTKVRKEVYEKIIELKVGWGLRSIRQAAHRILHNELLIGG